MYFQRNNWRQYQQKDKIYKMDTYVKRDRGRVFMFIYDYNNNKGKKTHFSVEKVENNGMDG